MVRNERPDAEGYYRLSKSQLVELANGLRASLQIGKQGINTNVIEEIKKTLKKRKLIKIKCLRYFVDSIEEGETNKQKILSVAEKLTKDLGCELIQIKGFAIVLFKRKE